MKTPTLSRTSAIWALTGALILIPSAAFTQSAAKPQTKAAAKPTSGVDAVISLVKGGMSETFVIKHLQREGKVYTLSTADLVKLQSAGVSEAIMTAMTEPAAGGGVAAGPAASGAVPASGPSASASAATPVVSASHGGGGGFPPDLPDVPSTRKRVVAVKAFDYSTVVTWVHYWFQADTNIGEGIRAMLTRKMSASRNVTLVERNKIDDVMKEQDFSASNRVKKGTNARIGQLQGADVMLYGDVVIFGRDDTTKRKGLGAWLGKVSPVAGAVATLDKEEKAVVGITLRLVDTETGVVIETADARGESSRKSKDYGAIVGVKGTTVNGSTAMSSSNFEATIIGEATVNAVAKVAEYLDGKVPALPSKPREIEGRVASIGTGTIVLNVGGQDGVQRGDRFEILQIRGETKDPVTKEVIDIDAVKIGEFVADGVREKTASGAYGGQTLQASYVAAAGKGYAARLMSK